ILNSQTSRRRFLASLAAPLAAAPLVRGMSIPKIKDVSVIATEPQGVRLVVVKIQTDQDGLYGYGCATFTQRADLVVDAVDRYLKPLIVGRPTDAVEDLWQVMYNSSYWRNRPVLNNAISGVDQVLWDIRGRQAGMPVYELLGWKCRRGAMVYRHASGREISQTIDQAKKLMAEGAKAVRLQVGVPGMAAYGAAGGPRKSPETGIPADPVFEPALSPENLDYFRQIRANCTTPLAMGELFNNPHEWDILIKGSLIDYIRMHVSEVGGLTPAWKIAAMAEPFQVKTAWHGPGDVSPVGHCANVTLDVVCRNFGIQEWTEPNERIQEVFQGYPELRDGYAYPNEKPGWGVEINEKAAAKYPFGTFERGERKKLNGGWGVVRRQDGTVINQ
ncbi:MAG: enolase C-terminal domain-like protein, partial [Bryobacteraceae bacterium]